MLGSIAMFPEMLFAVVWLIRAINRNTAPGADMLAKAHGGIVAARTVQSIHQHLCGRLPQVKRLDILRFVAERVTVRVECPTCHATFSSPVPPLKRKMTSQSGSASLMSRAVSVAFSTTTPRGLRARTNVMSLPLSGTGCTLIEIRD